MAAHTAESLRLKPYAVHWHPNLVTGWILLKGCDTRDEADKFAEDALQQYGGQVRVVTQHVIETRGLGA